LNNSNILSGNGVATEKVKNDTIVGVAQHRW